MTKVYIYSDSSLESFYEQTLQYLHDKYHVHPSRLSNQPFSPAEREALSYNDGQGRGAARNARRGITKRGDHYYNASGEEINMGKAVF